jgi:hypothetical protein
MSSELTDAFAILQGQQGEIPDMLAHLRGKSRPYTTNCASHWDIVNWNAKKYLHRTLPDILYGATLVEIGCGASPIIDQFPEIQLASYVGIDINPLALRDAQAKTRTMPFPIDFVLEDPVQTLRSRAPATVVSGSLLDDSIIQDETYGYELVAAIAASTPPNGLSIHVGMHGEYPRLLELAGFTNLANSMLYQKTNALSAVVPH